MLPSPDSATEKPCWEVIPLGSTSLPPCCVQFPPLSVNTHAAPTPSLSPGPPMMAVVPSLDSATEKPCRMSVLAERCSGSSAATAQLRARLIPHPAAAVEHPRRAERVVVGPAAHDGGGAIAGERDGVALLRASNHAGLSAPAPAAPAPLSFAPCRFHTLPLRVNTHAAPIELLSPGPPTIAVLPSADTATDQPSSATPFAASAVSFCCWVHVPPLRVKTHAAPAPLLSNGPPTMAVLPSAETATEKPCSGLPIGSLPVSFGTLLCAVAACVRHSSAEPDQSQQAKPRCAARNRPRVSDGGRTRREYAIGHMVSPSACVGAP